MCCADLRPSSANMDIVRETTGQRGHSSFFVFFFPNGAAFFTLDLEAICSISQELACGIDSTFLWKHYNLFPQRVR